MKTVQIVKNKYELSLWCCIYQKDFNLEVPDISIYGSRYPFYIKIRFMDFTYNNELFDGELVLKLKEDKERKLNFSSDYSIDYKQSVIYQFGYDDDARHDFILYDVSTIFDQLVSKKDIFEIVCQKAFDIQKQKTIALQEQLETALIVLEHLDLYSR